MLKYCVKCRVKKVKIWRLKKNLKDEKQLEFK